MDLQCSRQQLDDVQDFFLEIIFDGRFQRRHSRSVNMNFSEAEIEKLKELKRLKIYERLSFHPTVGSWIFFSDNLDNAFQVAENNYILLSSSEVPDRAIWLFTFDEILRAAHELKISFSQVTDYIHRKRYADGREREGLYQLLIETLRSTPLQPKHR